MSAELGGVESDSDGVAQSSETLPGESLLVKLAGEVKRETDGESDSGSEIENDSDDFCEKRNQKPKLESGEKLNLSESDLVWGKVRSYPWWPGQVCDASCATKNAMKHFKKGTFLVAYFGDSSFAWNDVTTIKPFHHHFIEMEKQSDSLQFRDAVDCALDEVSRRVEFGLSCVCLSEEAYSKVKNQNMNNPGIREDASVRYGGDKLSNAINFEPGKLFGYVKRLACFPRDVESDKLMFVTKRAQFLAFQQWKYETFLRSEESAAPITDEEMSTKKRKTDKHKQRFGFEDRTDETTEEKPLSDMIANKYDGKSHSGKKRKVESSESGKSEKKIKNNGRKEDSASKSSDVENNLSVGKKLQKVADDPCFRIGASKMNSSTPTVKPCGDSKTVEVENKKMKKPKHEEISSSDEMLSSLHSAKTQKGILESFSLDHSNYEDFEKFIAETSCSNLDHDSEKTSISDVKDCSEQQILPADEDITGSDSKEETGSAGSSAPNALFLKFADSGSVPSEEKLNSIFNRYGPLRESETQIMKKGKRAKVVFKNGEDAETAFSSSGKYSTFGPSLLSYSLKYVCPKAEQSHKMTN